MNRRELLTGAALLAGASQAEAFGVGRLGASLGRAGLLVGSRGPLPLPKWSAAKAAVLAGTRNAKLLAIGDSTSAGIGSASVGGGNNNARPGAWPVLLAASKTGSTKWAANSWFGIQNSAWNTSQLNNYDTRLSVSPFGVSWVANSGLYSVGGYPFGGVSAGTFLFLPSGGQCDTFDIWYPNNGAGVCTVNINGGSTLATITQTGTPSYQKTTVSAALGANTLNLVWVSGTPQILAVVGYNSAVKEVSAYVGGMSGTKAGTWNVAVNPWDDLNAIQTLAPDLSCIMLGINDWTPASPTAIATYTTQMQAIIDACKVSGDVIIMSPIPSQFPSSGQNASPAVQATFVAACRSLAQTNQLNFVDVYGLFGSWTNANANGWMSDPLHCTQLGYQQIANAAAPLV